MPTLSTAARNAAVDAVAALLNGGDVRLETSANQEIATCALGNPAFASASGGSATANTITDDTNANAGTVDHVLLRNSSGTTVITCTVTLVGGGGDFEATSLVYGAGDTVKITSLVMSQAAS